jgi:hypothetical protein
MAANLQADAKVMDIRLNRGNMDGITTAEYIERS